MVNWNIKNMLLTLVLNLGMAAGTVATPLPSNGGGYSAEQQYQRRQSEIEERIKLEDSNIIAIVQLCLKITTV
jgi:hypothetical protein